MTISIPSTGKDNPSCTGAVLPGPRARRRAVGALLVSTLLVIGLPATAAEQRHPDVLAAQVRASGADRFDFDVTVSSPYDTPQRYADGFRVTTTDGRVLGERKLWHDHAGEQPFTRELYGIAIPPAIRRVSIQARDQQYGYGGKSIDVVLPGRP
jgi:hypothetical protein